MYGTITASKEEEEEEEEEKRNQCLNLHIIVKYKKSPTFQPIETCWNAKPLWNAKIVCLQT